MNLFEINILLEIEFTFKKKKNKTY
jgi:hypothetical protein